VNGVIFDIKRFSLHDGPGIRTAVFLKGCPLSCLWCQNPEGIAGSVRLWYFDKKCIRCGTCVASCPAGALSTRGNEDLRILIDEARCTRCGTCAELCPTNALAFDGKTMTSGAVVREVLKDREFFETSGGGVTLTGGEPLAQPEFSLEILGECGRHGLHTAIETSLQADAGVVERFSGEVDLFIADLKLMDPDAHTRYTGAGNGLVLRNFRRLAKNGCGLLVRVPLIQGVTATAKNLRAVARYIRSVRAGIPIELINYNPLARSKYRNMGILVGLEDGLRPFTDGEIEEFNMIIAAEGVHPLGKE
jgi:pyruvate formate lyase activating enzyme